MDPSSSSTSTTTKSFGKRISGSFEGVVIGILFLFGALYLLWWNEGNFVRQQAALKEGKQTVIPVSNTSIDPTHQGKLIYTQGEAQGNEIIKDPIFQIPFQALKFKRIVKMYQWVEVSEKKTSKNWDGSEKTETRYSNQKEWRESRVDSGTFHDKTHTNPSEMRYKTSTFSAPSITIGAFELSSSMKQLMHHYEPYELTEENKAQLASSLQDMFHLDGGALYSGTPTTPAVGDFKIHYEIIAPGPYSVIGMQYNDTIDSYHAKKAKINLIEPGKRSPGALFSAAQERSILITWLVRAAGFLLIWFGLKFILDPLSVISSVIPFLGWAVRAGLNLVLIPISLALSFLTIALAWLYYRPLVASLIAAAGMILFYIGVHFIKKREKKRGEAS